MIDKTLIAALLAATTLMPAIGLSADTTPQAATGTAATGNPAAGKSASETAPATKPVAKKPVKKKQPARKAAADKAAADKATAEKAAADKPTTVGGASPASPASTSGAGKALAAGALGAAAVGLAATAVAAGTPVDYTKMTPTELTEYLIFDAKGFKLDQPTQEGTTGRERMTQDELQKTCSALRDKTIDAATAKKVQELAAASRVYPEGGVTLGDWKRGQALAMEGAGFRLGPKVDDNAKKFGGNCYACHQMDLKVSAHGTIGPSLTGFGKTRGNTPETQKYVYEVLYNAHAYFPCTNMPRFGANHFLNQEQMADLIAYVLDPESPVNK
jgi:sulfur-oxidizing protein SoxX